MGGQDTTGGNANGSTERSTERVSTELDEVSRRRLVEVSLASGQTSTHEKPRLRRFHQARWDEPIIFELSREGQRGVLVPQVEEEIRDEVGDVLATLPENMRRKQPPKLPELAQPQVLRHYVRLSQENLGADLNIEIGQGTCTMKYSPKINDQLATLPEIADLHPLQDEGTVQGILEVMYRFEQILKEISGMDQFSLQGRPVSGTRSSRPSSRTPRMRRVPGPPVSRSSRYIRTRTAIPIWRRCVRPFRSAPLG